jgi:hypothetical protein
MDWLSSRFGELDNWKNTLLAVAGFAGWEFSTTEIGAIMAVIAMILSALGFVTPDSTKATS